MKYFKTLTFILMIMALVAVPLTVGVKPASADPIYTCLPTCEEDDGRMVAIAGTGFSTLVGLDFEVEIAAPPETTSIEVGIFDGDTGGQWDVSEEALNYTLYYDPLGDGSGTTIIAEATGDVMPDNDWYTFNIPTAPEALSPSGNYFYRLVVTAPDPLAVFSNRFKVRSDGVLSHKPTPFAYLGAMSTWEDVYTLYPNYPDLSVSTYNGNFDFHAYVPNSLASFEIWDGDVDFGSADQVDNDTDDPDTPNEVLPPWANVLTAFEGVAVGYNGSTGQPPDDSASEITKRSPSVVYRLSPLDQTDYINENPSGNLEWERFSLETDTDLPADIYIPDRLPAGLYHIHMMGMDLSNLNAWRIPYKVIGVCEFDPEIEESNPCKNPLHPYKIGDTVFKDLNGNRVQDPGEPGRPGVVLYLYDNHGFPVLDIFNNPLTAITGRNGYYEFGVEPYTLDPFTGAVSVEGTYTVVVGEENFAEGGSLHGLFSTTGGDSQTHTVENSNVMIYDFGYGLQAAPSPSTGTAGWTYWSQNPDSWPVDEILVGGVPYNKDQAIELLGAKPAGDWTFKLFRELVTAKLNVANGNESSCIATDIQAADEWMAKFPPGSQVGFKSPAWKSIWESYLLLVEYNQGQLCAPPMQ